MRRLAALTALSAGVAVAAASVAWSAAPFKLTPVGRLTFPARAYVVDLPAGLHLRAHRVGVTENGARIHGVTVEPVGETILTLGTVLALDASDSMQGTPFERAVGAVHEFVIRRNPNQEIGVLAFNSKLTLVQELTKDPATLTRALVHPPRLAYGTRIFDAAGRALGLLESRGISAGSIVILSDGADVGSATNIDAVVARARRDHVRIFTVGLRSAAFDKHSLRRLASQTGGSYIEAEAPGKLLPIYAKLGRRLASEYVVRYRSSAAPGRHVNVSVSIPGAGSVSTGYTASATSAAKPYRQALVDRFLLSTASLVVLAMLAAALAGLVMLSLLRRQRSAIVDRIGAFVPVADASGRAALRIRRSIPRPPRRDAIDGRLARLALEFEIGGITIPPTVFVLLTAVATVLSVIVLALISPPFAILAILVPIGGRSWVVAKVKRVRDRFADQLPETLQLLASALRTGYSFTGAMSVVVEQSAEPIKTEFGRVVTDDQIGVPIDDALRRVATRMVSRDMTQVSLLGELQRTAGGNAAEVLDTVVETVRERAEVRRLAMTLTAQGRMSRWILTIIPLLIGLFLLVTERPLMRPLYSTGLGQAALVLAILMLVAGSLSIKKIIEIKV